MAPNQVDTAQYSLLACSALCFFLTCSHVTHPFAKKNLTTSLTLMVGLFSSTHDTNSPFIAPADSIFSSIFFHASAREIPAICRFFISCTWSLMGSNASGALERENTTFVKLHGLCVTKIPIGLLPIPHEPLRVSGQQRIPSPSIKT